MPIIQYKGKGVAKLCILPVTVSGCDPKVQYSANHFLVCTQQCSARLPAYLCSTERNCSGSSLGGRLHCGGVATRHVMHTCITASSRVSWSHCAMHQDTFRSLFCHLSNHRLSCRHIYMNNDKTPSKHATLGALYAYSTSTLAELESGAHW